MTSCIKSAVAAKDTSCGHAVRRTHKFKSSVITVNFSDKLRRDNYAALDAMGREVTFLVDRMSNCE
jgi:hypothetical protein